MTTGTFKAPGLFPGALEISFYGFFLFVSGLFMNELKTANDHAALGGLTFVAIGIGFFLLKRRHKKRLVAFPDVPAAARIRDLAIFGLLGMFALPGGMLFAEVRRLQEMGLIAAFIGLLALIVTSVLWSKLSGGKSKGWGAVFCAGGIFSLYVASDSLGPISDTFDGLKEFNENSILTFISLLAVISGYALQGVASVFGGLSLFKEIGDRAGEVSKLSVFLGKGYIFIGLGMVIGVFAAIPMDRGHSDQELMKLTMTPGLLMGFLIFFSGIGMGKYLKELKSQTLHPNSGEAISAGSESTTVAPGSTKVDSVE